ncbi:hypothetical protein ES703_96457 [subsurface metagenome]
MLFCPKYADLFHHKVPERIPDFGKTFYSLRGKISGKLIEYDMPGVRRRSFGLWGIFEMFNNLLPDNPAHGYEF